jgi:phosphoglycerol transferase MdoB-like AlkP superfamily enzyme
MNENIGSESEISPFIKDVVLRQENRQFVINLIILSVGYLIITLWLNSIRVSAPIWFVWVLIAVQLILYASIFYTSFQRAKTMGLGGTVAAMTFTALALIGRINDWEIVVIPLVVIAMIVFSARNKRISTRSQAMLRPN